MNRKKKQKISDEEFEKSQNYIGQLDDDFSDWNHVSYQGSLEKWTEHSKLEISTSGWHKNFYANSNFNTRALSNSTFSMPLCKIYKILKLLWDVKMLKFIFPEVLVKFSQNKIRNLSCEFANLFTVVCGCV